MFAKTLMEKSPRPVVTAPPRTPFADALDLLVTNDIGCLPILDSGRLVGIVFAKAALRWVHATDGRYHDCTAADVMTKDIVVGQPSDDLIQLAALMDSAGLTHVPILDNEELVGVVSQRDIIHWQAGDHAVENRYLNLYLDSLANRDSSGHV